MRRIWASDLWLYPALDFQKLRHLHWLWIKALAMDRVLAMDRREHHGISIASALAMVALG